ncbi:acyl-CoA dehydrogenase family protein [Streptosporangium sp. DT93]|uniref:acyl-CoA dehydrogenase family protein n=1 Tax=Streptosporangium sp. DT93 TaxID=3393428 RepID=UPI003CF30C55
MNFAFTDDQLALAATVRDVLAAHCPPRAVRTERTPAWSRLAEIGLFGLMVPEEYEGLGLGLVDAVPALEETGRAALPGPVAETVAAAPALLAGNPLLGELAKGSLRVSTIVGDQVYAPDADLADLLIVERDGVPYAVSPDRVRLTPQPGVDRTRRLFGVDLGTVNPRTVDPGAEDGAEAGSGGASRPEARGVTRLTVPTEGVVRPPVPGGGVVRPPVLGGGLVRLPVRTAPAVRAVTVAVAAQLVGLARHLLDASVAHALTRRQFGVPIGSFQAVKHLLADVAVAVEFTAPLVCAAAVAVDRDLPSAGRDVAAAKAGAGETAELAARAALQVHGAMGYTEEFDLHLWLARVWSLSAAHGGTALHRSRLRAMILGRCSCEGPSHGSGEGSCEGPDRRFGEGPGRRFGEGSDEGPGGRFGEGPREGTGEGIGGSR